MDSLNMILVIHDKQLHLQSKRRMEVCGPMYPRKECDGESTYGPGPPMIIDLFT